MEALQALLEKHAADSLDEQASPRPPIIVDQVLKQTFIFHENFFLSIIGYWHTDTVSCLGS